MNLQTPAASAGTGSSTPVPSSHTVTLLFGSAMPLMTSFEVLAEDPGAVTTGALGALESSVKTL